MCYGSSCLTCFNRVVRECVMTLYSSGLITCRVEREETVRTCVGCCIEWYEQQVGLVLKTPMEDLVKMLDWNWFRQRAVARGDVEGG